ncbi:MAG: hypothetical protein JO058_24560 [Alphaproteobacteria bacterium]|nr:hypothetical protein [Alphaproteobacteria bacterium]
MAAAITDSAELRDSYLALSIEYERLASLLEIAASASPASAAKPDEPAAEKAQSQRRTRSRSAPTR